MKVLSIGLAAYDITIPFDGFPIENNKYRVKEKIECGGGPASNAAYLLAKWKVESYFAGIIGNDIYGKKILKEFNEIGLHTSFLEINKEINTSSSVIIVNEKTATRTVLTHCDNNVSMKDFELDIKPNFILLDGQEFEASKKILTKCPQAISVIDAGTARDTVVELAKMVNYLVCSKSFAEDVSNIKIDYNNASSLVNCYTKLKEKFKNNIIITLEEYGCLYEINGKLKIMPTLEVKAKDTTGAGDIFHGAFVYGLVNGFDLEKALKYANIAGSLSVTQISGRKSIPSLEEVEEKYATFE